MLPRPLVTITVTVNSEMPSSTVIISTSYDTTTETKDSNFLSESEDGHLDIHFHPQADGEVSSQASITSHIHSHSYAEQPSSDFQSNDYAEDNLGNLSIHDIEVRIAYLRYEMTAHARTTIASNYELWLARCQWQSKLDKLWEEFCGFIYDQRAHSWEEAIALLVPPGRWRERQLRGRQLFDRWRQLHRGTIGLAKHRFYQAQEAERELMLGEQMVLQDPLAPGDLNALSSRLDVLREQWVTERMAILRPMIDFEWARATEESTWEELRLLKVELIEVYHRLERRARRE
ncbi:hypothetical protein GE09DRAFT_1278445 [Coniochaeta sp. 2T2.1]|nr:hypothetical protein GE09DRAFT_1278445 [Coniochaeta sp. 2T2.1]